MKGLYIVGNPETFHLRASCFLCSNMQNSEADSGHVFSLHKGAVVGFSSGSSGRAGAPCLCASLPPLPQRKCFHNTPPCCFLLGSPLLYKMRKAFSFTGFGQAFVFYWFTNEWLIRCFRITY